MSHSSQLLFLLYFLLSISPWIVSSYQQCHDDLRFDSVHLIRRSSIHHIHPCVHPIHQSIHSSNRSSVHHMQASNHPANRSSVHPANRDNHIMFDQCEHDLKKLVHLTNPMKQPWFVELSGVIEKEMLTITVVMNVKMMKNSKRINHFDYSAFINGQWYSNRNHIHQAPEVLLQTYSTRLMKRDMRRMRIIIRDNKNGIEYKNLPICIRKEMKPVDMGVCTHVSKFNTIPEIASWVMFHLSQGMDRIIIMICTPYPELFELFDEEIKNGKVILVHFEWPIPKRGLYQLNYQVASMTTCYQRYRRNVKTLFFVDVDEYIHSVSNPFNFKPILSVVTKHGCNRAHVMK